MKNRQTVSLVHLEMVREREIPYGKANTPKKAIAVLKDIADDLIGNMDRECMVVCATDTGLKPVCVQIIGIGTIDTCPASIPEIFKTALLANANHIIVFHNHPSGDPTPSRADTACTQKIQQAGKILDIKLLDHIIIGSNGAYYSFQGSQNIHSG